MASLTIRQLDDDFYARLKLDAKANHRSIEAEARYRLERSDPPRPPRERLADRFRRVMADPGPEYEGSVALIRSIRDDE